MHNSLSLFTDTIMNLKRASLTMKFNKSFIAIAVLLLFGCTPAPEKQTNKIEKKTAAVEDGVQVQDGLPKSYAIGNKATAEVIAGWDIEIRPDGLGLPEGSGSVEDGEDLYEDKCAMCHGSFGEGEDQWPKLAGGAGTLLDERPQKSVGSFWPYASTLWDYINRAMPFTAPQSLSPDEVYAITAYVLNLNEIVDDEFVLTKENFASIEMPNKDGFYLDDRPDTTNTRCMKDCKDPASIKVTLGPKYSINVEESVEVEEQDVTEHPGKATYDIACKACHASGLANAPKYGDKEGWTERLTQGTDTLYDNAINGINGMPAKGGRVDLSDEVVKQAVDYMLESVK